MLNIVRTWKDIPGYKGLYAISDYGQILDINTGKYLDNFVNEDGQVLVRLFKNNTEEICIVCVLIAITFIGFANDHSQLRHINGNKEDNRVANLEWVSQNDDSTSYYSKLFNEQLRQLKYEQIENLINALAITVYDREPDIDNANLSQRFFTLGIALLEKLGHRFYIEIDHVDFPQTTKYATNLNQSGEE